jgi:hypothetical protein
MEVTMQFDWNIVSSWATLIAALAAVYALIQQGRLTRLSVTDQADLEDHMGVGGMTCGFARW